VTSGPRADFRCAVITGRPISASAALTAAAACGTFIVIVFRKWRNTELRAGRAMAVDAVDYRWPTLKTKAKIIFPALEQSPSLLGPRRNPG
jgi:hypothetical protein